MFQPKNIWSFFCFCSSRNVRNQLQKNGFPYSLKIESPLERVYVPSFRGNPILSGCMEGKLFLEDRCKGYSFPRNEGRRDKEWRRGQRIRAWNCLPLIKLNCLSGWASLITYGTLFHHSPFVATLLFLSLSDDSHSAFTCTQPVALHLSGYIYIYTLPCTRRSRIYSSATFHTSGDYEIIMSFWTLMTRLLHMLILL